jgi:hypothetical protein
MIRTLNEAEINFDLLISAINKISDHIESVVVVLDGSMAKYEEKLKKISKVRFVDEFKLLEE